MLLLLAVSLAVVGVSPGLSLGAGQCSWGPAYWCANIPQASQCGAMAHCIKAVWEKETVAADDDEVCKICKDMVGQARDTLLSNETQEELKEVFDGSCDLIPIKIIAKECRTLSDQFIPELVETLASEMNPDTVCTVSGLCNSARIDTMLEQQRQYGGDCNLCREGAREVKERLASLSQEQITDRAMELCGYLGTFSSACMETVADSSDEIYRMLTEQFDEEICDLSGLCSQSFEKVPATTLQPGEDIQCEFCEKVIQHWIDVYASNSSLQEFKALLDGICEKIDTKNAAHCKHIVDDYYIPAFKFIKNELKPHMLCSMVGLCTESQTSKAPIISLTKLEPALRVENLAALNGELYVPSSVVDASTPTCVLCEYVIDTLDDYIKDRKNEAEIEKAVESVCEKMPGAIRNKCDKFVEKYEPAIVAFIVNNIESSKICSLLHLCDEQNNVQSNELRTLSKDSNCEMCEFAMNEIFSVLQDKDDQDMVKNALESICYRLPDSIERNCEDFVEKYTNTIINMIVSGLTPDEICSALNLCTSETTPSPAPSPTSKADTTCVLCEYIITTLDTMLEDKTNKDEIKETLEKLCSVLPSSVKDQCDTFVETYTDLIIDMLTKDVSPEMICTNLGLCKSAGNIVQHRVEIKKKPYCALCEMVITQLDQMLEDKTNEAQIEQALDVVCFSLPDPVHKQCEKLVTKYTEKIIDMFVAEYTPALICAELSLCINNDINTNNIHQVSFDSEETTEIVKESIGCELCEFAMKIVDQHLTNPNTIDEVERMVQFLCSYMPGTIADKCEEFVDKYGQMVIDMIVQDELDPTEVCGSLMPECSNRPRVTDTRCPWGPAYWCATPFHARTCGTTQHCKNTVWKKRNIQK